MNQVEKLHYILSACFENDSEWLKSLQAKLIETLDHKGLIASNNLSIFMRLGKLHITIRLFILRLRIRPDIFILFHSQSL